MTDLNQAPGCFGAASIVDPDEAVCGACVYLTPCREQAKATLERIRTRINVSDLLRKHGDVTPASEPVMAPVQLARALPAMQSPMVPVRVTPLARSVVAEVPGEDALLASLPVKPREIAQRLLRAGSVASIKSDVQAGRVPAAVTKPEFLRVAFDALLAGGCSRSVLKQRFQDELGWGEGTASSHVGIAQALLRWLDVMNEGWEVRR